MIDAATPIKPKKGAEEGQRSETAASNTVDSIVNSTNEMRKYKWVLMVSMGHEKRGKVETGAERKNEDRVIRTPNLLIWNQTRYRCAMPSCLCSLENPI